MSDPFFPPGWACGEDQRGLWIRRPDGREALIEAETEYLTCGFMGFCVTGAKFPYGEPPETPRCDKCGRPVLPGMEGAPCPPT